MSAFTGMRIRFSTAPSGSEMIEEAASAAVAIQSPTASTPAPTVLLTLKVIQRVVLKT